MEPDRLLSRKQVELRTGLGRRQAKLLMIEIGIVRLGNRDYVRESALIRFLPPRAAGEAK